VPKYNRDKLILQMKSTPRMVLECFVADITSRRLRGIAITDNESTHFDAACEALRIRDVRNLRAQAKRYVKKNTGLLY
jgi:hypothetical protein